PQQFTTPYTISQVATFVPNTSGAPAYYLSISHTIINVHPTELFPYGTGEIIYVPFSFSNFVSDPPQCHFSLPNEPSCSLQTRLTAGLYQDAAHTFGTAVLMRPTWSFASRSGVYFSLVPPSTDGSANLSQSLGVFSVYWSPLPTSVQSVQ